MCAYFHPCSNQGGFSVTGGYVNVHADGSCLRNGQNQPQAGIGVWFGDNHPLNLSEPVRGLRATNIVAEIQAVRRAAEQATRHNIFRLRIHTDSEFVINCFTEWIFIWERNGWRRSDGAPVENQQELQELDNILVRLNIAWNFVQSHSGNYGNQEADRLARAGARLYEPF